jgi:hypothetical protein
VVLVGPRKVPDVTALAQASLLVSPDAENSSRPRWVHPKFIHRSFLGILLSV